MRSSRREDGRTHLHEVEERISGLGDLGLDDTVGNEPASLKKGKQ